MTLAGEVVTLWVLAAMTAGALVVALRQWPSDDPLEIAHEHPDLSSDHPHVRDGHRHAHSFTIDDLHPSWPTSG